MTYSVRSLDVEGAIIIPTRQISAGRTPYLVLFCHNRKEIMNLRINLRLLRVAQNKELLGLSRIFYEGFSPGHLIGKLYKYNRFSQTSVVLYFMGNSN